MIKRYTHGTTGMLLREDGEWCRAADYDALAARLAEAERNEGTLLGMIHHQRDVLRECLPYLNESMAGKRPGRSADDIRAAVKALTSDSAPAAELSGCSTCDGSGYVYRDDLIWLCRECNTGASDQPDSAEAVMERPWQEIVKDATRYMWLRRRVDTAPARGLYPWSDAAAMDAAIDTGMAATSQPTVAKEKGE